jgi:hypothetical protein
VFEVDVDVDVEDASLSNDRSWPIGLVPGREPTFRIADLRGEAN